MNIDLSKTNLPAVTGNQFQFSAQKETKKLSQSWYKNAEIDAETAKTMLKSATEKQLVPLSHITKIIPNAIKRKNVGVKNLKSLNSADKKY